MAFTQAQTTAATANSSKAFNKYVGVANMKIIAINPSGKQLSELFGGKQMQDQVYTKSSISPEGKKITTTTVSIWLRNDELNITTNVRFLISDTGSWNKDKTKFQVIDDYGRTAWVTAEEFSLKKKPISSNGKEIKISTPYRVCYKGEENLQKFIRAFLGIKDVMQYKNGGMKEILDDTTKGILDTVKEKIALGDIDEIKKSIALQPQESEIKVMLGVKITEEGKEYQVVSPDVFDFAYSKAQKTGSYYKFAQAISNYEQYNRNTDTRYSSKAAEVYNSSIQPDSIKIDSQSIVISNAGPSESTLDIDVPF